MKSAKKCTKLNLVSHATTLSRIGYIQIERIIKYLMDDHITYKLEAVGGVGRIGNGKIRNTSNSRRNKNRGMAKTASMNNR